MSTPQPWLICMTPAYRGHGGNARGGGQLTHAQVNLGCHEHAYGVAISMAALILQLQRGGGYLYMCLRHTRTAEYVHQN